MPGGAKNRRAGDYFERQTKRDLERHGWLVIRAPGSGSGSDGTPLQGTGVDLLAICKYGAPLLVSCKVNGRVRPAERERLKTAAERYGAVPVVAWRYANGRVAYRSIPEGMHHGAPILKK